VPPSLAVIVPIFDVEDYLRPCLDSVLAQTRPPSQVILVDDGSTDSSGRIADEYAAAHPGWQVLHVENGGLGRARNLGFERVGTDYVAFLDSDDVVPPSGYDLLLSHLEESDSDIASGAVMRYDGTSLLPSPLHVRAIQSTELGTHITRSPQLIFDTTAWNKVFRTAFWRQHGLAFPEGVFYEDIPVTIPAHYLARSVDVVAEPVYWWRERQTASVSITQRRGEVRNLVDRMTAIETVERFLVERGLVEDKLRHDRKVITDGSREVVLYHLKGNMHDAAMLMAYLPADRVVDGRLQALRLPPPAPAPPLPTRSAPALPQGPPRRRPLRAPAPGCPPRPCRRA